MWSETIQLGDRTITIENGEVARQAGGSVVVKDGKTVLLATATADKRPSDRDFLPLTIEFRYRHAAGGRIPGGYTRREGRPGDWEILNARLIDRSLRPLFPKGYRFDTQVIITILSFDQESQLGALGITAAAFALMVSDLPWQGPVAGLVLSGRGKKLDLMPTPEEEEKADFSLTVAASPNGVVMAEGSGREATEDQVVEAFDCAGEVLAPVMELQRRRQTERGCEKRAVPEPPSLSGELQEQLESALQERLPEALAEHDKLAHKDAVKAAKKSAIGTLGELSEEDQELAEEAADAIYKKAVRSRTLEGERLDGHAPEEIRPISGRVAWLPGAHGSALFTRGETQVSVTCTLGSGRDARRIDMPDGEEEREFLLHYNFPPYSVGEVRPIRGPGRREIGHGHLARRALLPLLPEESGYTIRIDSIVTESNGSSSMATVCGGCMSLLDAGIELARPVAGIAMGLIKRESELVVLSDIQGAEDHFGDMDFKVAGTEKGITSIQIDNKLGALPREVMGRALDQAREGRLHILERMAAIIQQPRKEMKDGAPRLHTMTIETNRIRDLIGPGGSVIREIQEQTDSKIDVSQEGEVSVYATSGPALREAIERVEQAAGVPRLNEVYEAVVVTSKHYGCFVRLFPGIEALLHGSDAREGQKVKVKVTGVNDEGKLELAHA